MGNRMSGCTVCRETKQHRERKFTMKPFRDMDLSRSLAACKEKMKAKIDSFTNDEIMANDIELLADNIYEQFYIQPVVIHDEDLMRRELKQAKVRRYTDPFFRDAYGREYVDVDGFEMTFYYPYEGETDLFKCRASTFSLSGYPEITIRQDTIVLKYERTLQEMEREGAVESVLKSAARDLEQLRSGINYANNDVSYFNSTLRTDAVKALAEKKKKVESFYSIASMFEVPVTKTEYAAKHVPMKRNIAPIAHKYERQSTYCITDRDYAEILETIKHTGSTYERTPSSYAAMHEEDLRNTLLAALNATYKGDAMGEAFRNKGKTDICIERENRAAFVAECKMWTGQKDVQPAVEQLDSYLTWRDCKTALIYFVRRKDFLRVLSTAEATLRSIPFMRSVDVVDENEFKCLIASKATPGQLVQVRVMLFNLYSE